MDPALHRHEYFYILTYISPENVEKVVFISSMLVKWPSANDAISETIQDKGGDLSVLQSQ